MFAIHLDIGDIVLKHGWDVDLEAVVSARASESTRWALSALDDAVGG